MSQPQWRISLVARVLRDQDGLTLEDRAWLRQWWFTWGSVSDDEARALGTLAQIVVAARCDAKRAALKEQGR